MKTLVIKILETINNDKMPYLGVFEFSTKTSEIKEFRVGLGGGTSSFTAVNGLLSTSTLAPAKEITLSGWNKTINLTDDVDRVLIKGDISSISSLSNIILNDGIYLSYLTNLTSITFLNCNNVTLKDFSDKMTYIDSRGGLIGSFSDIKSTSLTRLSMYSQNAPNVINGTLLEASKHLAKNSLDEFVIEDNNISGDIYNLVEAISLNSSSSINLKYCSNVTGRVESIINYLEGKKKNSSLYLNLVGTKATYNDAPITKKIVLTFDDNGNVSVS